MYIVLYLWQMIGLCPFQRKKLLYWSIFTVQVSTKRMVAEYFDGEN